MRLAAVLLAAVTAVGWPVPPPPAAIRPVTDHLADGRVVHDPYRWLERMHDPAVQRYFKSQATYANAVFARLGPGRETLRRRIERYSNAGTSVSSLTRVGHDLFYLERPPSANDARLMVREGSSTPRLLLDPDVLGKRLALAGHLTIEGFAPSYDGTHVAVNLVVGGAEREAHTRFIETATSTLLDDDLPRSNIASWSPDGTTFYYNQLPDVGPGHEAEAELNSLMHAHVLGSSAADPVIFGIGHDPAVPFQPNDMPFVETPVDSQWAIGLNQHGVENEVTVYVAPVASLTQATIPWRKIADVGDAVTGFDLRGNTIYLLTHAGAPTYKVTALDLTQAGTAATATTVVPAGTGVIEAVAVAHDALYVRGVNGGPAELRRRPWRSDGSLGPLATVPLPFAGTIEDFTTDPRVDGVALGFVSWTRPLLVYEASPDGTLHDTAIIAPPAIDTTPYVSREVRAPSTGGVRVPLSIIMRRGTKLDGTHPVYIEAYGSYGYSIDPYFLGTRFSWLDAGGVWVVAHVRGGGEFGENWHLAGQKRQKQHTIDDAIAAARYVIAQHYTTPAHLAIEGTSAGGITVGGAITQHPELFAAALDVVGETNALRDQDDPNGPPGFPEFGNSVTPEGASLLYPIDAYQHIRDGVRYPAVLGITGINDPRVPPWQVAKFVARLAHATSSGKPVLMRVDYDAGHGFLAASRAQAVALLTDEFSFLLWQCGSPLFAGIPTRIGRP